MSTRYDMFNCDKLIKKIKIDLYLIIVPCIILTLVAIIFIFKEPILIVFWCTVVIILLSKHIMRFVKFKNNVVLPAKEILNKELEGNIIEYAGCIFTENYIINQMAYWIINYEDILLINKHWSIESGAVNNHPCIRLYLVTKKGNYSFILYSASNYKSDYKLSEQVYEYIKNKNPNILIGDTKENKTILEKQYNIKLPWNWRSQAEKSE